MTPATTDDDFSFSFHVPPCGRVTGELAGIGLSVGNPVEMCNWGGYSSSCSCTRCTLQYIDSSQIPSIKCSI